jgi:hypothetical protein
MIVSRTGHNLLFRIERLHDAAATLYLWARGVRVVFACSALVAGYSLLTFWPVCKESLM